MLVQPRHDLENLAGDRTKQHRQDRSGHEHSDTDVRVLLSQLQEDEG